MLLAFPDGPLTNLVERTKEGRKKSAGAAFVLSGCRRAAVAPLLRLAA